MILIFSPLDRVIAEDIVGYLKRRVATRILRRRLVESDLDEPIPKNEPTPTNEPTSKNEPTRLNEPTPKTDTLKLTTPQREYLPTRVQYCRETICCVPKRCNVIMPACYYVEQTDLSHCCVRALVRLSE